jgi:peptidoglycan/xylan/chitin deacetylase (PgdA/CDA1 family)
MKFVTTSWDDGHPLDIKLAELLDKYKLAATFYIPRCNRERSVMAAKHIQQLSKKFEIGSHTLNHVRLQSKNKTEAVKEIYGSFLWLEDLLGYAPVSFCFPGGTYDQLLVDEVFASGYKLARTTEMLRTTYNTGNFVMPTTLQLYDHSVFTYAKHLLKRKRFTSLIHFLASNSSYNILKLTENYFTQTDDDDVFHLWGHSWEIEQYNLWHKLCDVFSIIAYNRDCLYVQNKHIVQYHQPEKKSMNVNHL